MKTTRRRHSFSPLATLVLTALAATPVCATDGYFDFGYGIQSKGTGGAGVAFPQDSLAPAINPAGVAFLANRVDAGLTYFQPDRGASLGPAQFDGNGIQRFYIPEAGFNYSLSEHFDTALAVYGNGGMNTDYKTPIPGFGTTSAGVNLSQVFITPTVAYRINENHAFGIAPLFAIQDFKAHGLQDFGIQNNGDDYSYGGGVRIGYTGKFTDWLTVGATYQSRVFTTGFSKYSNLFAEQGSFDIPSNFAFGLAVKPVKKLTYALDVERILYSEVKSVGNELSGATLANGLGSDGGPGFGWRDVTAVKTGFAFEATSQLTLRLGYNYSSQPIPENQTYFNILAPGVVQHHITAGLTWKFTKHFEASAFYAHAFDAEVNGSGNFGGANANIRMSQDTFGLGVGWLF